MAKTGFIFFIVLLCTAKPLAAQENSMSIPHIAVFGAFYLDSAFDASGNYRLGKTVPRYLNTSLDFYQGMGFALDSLNNEGLHLDVKVFDTKAKTSIYQLADGGALDSTDLIIGAVSGSDYLDLANVAKEKQIPFVSVTYPNDGGVKNNPFVIIVNSRLNTHLRALYNYVLRNHGTRNIVLFRRQSAADNRVSGVFKSLNSSSSGSLLNIKTVTLNTNFTPADISNSLSKDRENVIICGSLDDLFAKKLIAAAASLAGTYKNTLIGMPTWEGFSELETTEMKPVTVIYSSTFIKPAPPDTWGSAFLQLYAQNTYEYPSETAFRGYEIMYLFGHLLDQYPGERLQDKLSDTNFRVYTDFDFKPVFGNPSGTTPDFFENKRIFLLKKLNGEVSRLN